MWVWKETIDSIGIQDGHTPVKPRPLANAEGRRILFKAFCDHIAKGNVKSSFHFDNGIYRAVAHTIERYIKDFPHEFDLMDLDIAYAKCYEIWENAVGDAALGYKPSAHGAALQMILRNKLGWDRQEREPVNKAEIVELFASLKTYVIEQRGPEIISSNSSLPPCTSVENEDQKQS